MGGNRTRKRDRPTLDRPNERQGASEAAQSSTESVVEGPVNVNHTTLTFEEKSLRMGWLEGRLSEGVNYTEEDDDAGELASLRHDVITRANRDQLRAEHARVQGDPGLAGWARRVEARLQRVEHIQSIAERAAGQLRKHGDFKVAASIVALAGRVDGWGGVEQVLRYLGTQDDPGRDTLQTKLMVGLRSGGDKLADTVMREMKGRGLTVSNGRSYPKYSEVLWDDVKSGAARDNIGHFAVGVAKSARDTVEDVGYHIRHPIEALERDVKGLLNLPGRVADAWMNRDQIWRNLQRASDKELAEGTGRVTYGVESALAGGRVASGLTGKLKQIRESRRASPGTKDRPSLRESMDATIDRLDSLDKPGTKVEGRLHEIRAIKDPPRRTGKARPVRWDPEKTLSSEDLRGLGMPEANQAKIQRIADQEGVEILVRPGKETSTILLEKGAHPKPQPIKAKTGDDGRVVYAAPKPPRARRKPEGMSQEDWEKQLREEGLTPKELDQQLRKQEQDFLEAQGDYHEQGPKMTELQKPGHEIQISISKEGAVTGKPPGGHEAPVAGDHDVFEIYRKGKPVSKAEHDRIIEKMKQGDMGVRHGAHERWNIKAEKNPKAAGEAKEAISQRYLSGREPLVRFAPGETPSAVKARSVTEASEARRNRAEGPKAKTEGPKGRTDRPDRRPERSQKPGERPSGKRDSAQQGERRGGGEGSQNEGERPTRKKGSAQRGEGSNQRGERSTPQKEGSGGREGGGSSGNDRPGA